MRTQDPAGTVLATASGVNGLALMENSASRQCGPDDIGRIVAEIVRYLDAHPHAADTLEGIARWWLAPPLSALSIDTLEQALAQLIERGLVERAPLGDGRFVYHARRTEPQDSAET